MKTFFFLLFNKKGWVKLRVDCILKYLNEDKCIAECFILSGGFLPFKNGNSGTLLLPSDLNSNNNEQVYE